MALNVETLEKSIKALEQSVNVYYIYKEDDNKDLVETISSGVIQNFEVAYENSWKLIARWLDENISADTSHKTTKKGLFRLAGEYFLIDDVNTWIEFHESRNSTSHIYSNEISYNVLQYALKFPSYARYLLKNLKERK
ncbi:HI0074 family nucleotidyltransferase substrate-binding subunit [Brachyspira hyodysenteriae]|uniref:HI0074 family nucleotidyltransferase substrate-binding subunit n=1 Tax=Brachyspira hyodysenteriae TaxID=159 RepID=UPI001FCFAF8C|nr:HI0074 family nucleotidyltransferase substrate-binding subunit [Brachyspira hyodysenteriae]MCZ9918329.1 nucleotidyltransferase substrate binding protein [Brachyspira hyodysenteriae]MCZ9963039.1 nucleotidyltransferase substrate binding protein [Brachyspira hyodysenteriae]MCZ9980101.1 nucleotidyltransferase substrate binding protein [Brachyspira hyodysenteriae]MDA0156195.1 nucleotidyltransferase substrate binding protein [Brachyspira hyodysenteriae]